MVETFFLEKFKDIGVASFMTNRVIFGVFVENKLTIVFVYGIICQVHAKVVQIVVVRSTICLCREHAQAFVKHINSEGFNTANEYVNSKIEFQSINQERLVQISLNNEVVIRINIIQTPG